VVVDYPTVGATNRPPVRSECETGCSHDLARGVLTSELLGKDGPYPPPDYRVVQNAYVSTE